MHDIFVDSDDFLLPLTFLGPRRHTERTRAFHRGMDVGRTEKGKRVMSFPLPPLTALIDGGETSSNDPECSD